MASTAAEASSEAIEDGASARRRRWPRREVKVPEQPGYLARLVGPVADVRLLVAVVRPLDPALYEASVTER